ncbi:MAG: YabP/YqfC family sporulation protein [Anaeroplasmataceae bacterium]|nr:YabP/YqfC family sporulation protein [Anaeroplasmataceae bacterium]
MQFEYYKNILSISNYRQIQQMDSDLIALENIRIEGHNLKVLRLDKDSILIQGVIIKIEMKEDKKNDLQN